jgi:hypothetical protein
MRNLFLGCFIAAPGFRSSNVDPRDGILWSHGGSSIRYRECVDEIMAKCVDGAGGK